MQVGGEGHMLGGTLLKKTFRGKEVERKEKTCKHRYIACATGVPKSCPMKGMPSAGKALTTLRVLELHEPVEEGQWIQDRESRSFSQKTLLS